MKIKNIEVGDWIEAKKSVFSPIQEGHSYEVVKIDKDEAVLVKLIDCSFDIWWVDPVDFRKPKVKEELTGNALCKAMLKSDSKVIMCAVSDISERIALQNELVEVVNGKDTNGNFTTIDGESWRYVVPLNNKGEPLTSSDVGL